MKPHECLAQIREDACPVINDIRGHKVDQCMKFFAKLETVLESCSPDNNITKTRILLDWAMVYCCNYLDKELNDITNKVFIFWIASEVKCGTKDTIEEKTIFDKCMADKIDNVKYVDNVDGHFHKCREEVGTNLTIARYEHHMSDFLSCIAPQKQLLDQVHNGECRYTDSSVKS